MLELLGISLCSYTGMQSKGEHSMNLCFSLPKKGASRNRLDLFINMFIYLGMKWDDGGGGRVERGGSS